jgi:hypothetical protein
VSRDPTADETAVILGLLKRAGSVAELRRWIKLTRQKPARGAGRPPGRKFDKDELILAAMRRVQAKARERGEEPLSLTRLLRENASAIMGRPPSEWGASKEAMVKRVLALDRRQRKHGLDTPAWLRSMSEATDAFYYNTIEAPDAENSE